MSFSSPNAVGEPVTESEYLAGERQSLERHEYRDGVVVELPGSSRDHSLIVGNIAGLIGREIRNSAHELYCVAMRVRVPHAHVICYPDIVVCVEPECLDEQNDVLLNPTFLCEVMSPRTIEYDCGLKAQAYRTLASLREFLLVEQCQATVEHFVRESQDTWRIRRVEGLAGLISIESLRCTLDVADVYARVRAMQ